VLPFAVVSKTELRYWYREFSYDQLLRDRPLAFPPNRPDKRRIRRHLWTEPAVGLNRPGARISDIRQRRIPQSIRRPSMSIALLFDSNLEFGSSEGCELPCDT
jgi:hypothetical protein